MLEYKGYVGHVGEDDEARIFHGDVINFDHVVTFQGKHVDELEEAFRESVDVYLEFCQKKGIEPSKPFSGKFMVRLDPNLHRDASAAAKTSGMSLNAWVTKAIEKETIKAL